jgi:DNA adenine methylase
MSYLGSKRGAGVYQSIISQFPPHDTYIEAFLGSGAIMQLKPPAQRSIGIDLSPGCIDGFDSAGQQNIELIHGDCVATLAGFDYARSRTLIYADPPYLHETRTSRHRYEFEYTLDDHIRLLELLKTLPASIVISGYPAGLYDELLQGWRTIEFQAMTRGGVRTEKLWMNYDHVPHWHTYAGKNFTDRQRIKRKASRWAEDFQTMKPAERLAILAELMATISHS